jgi:hypothetical protein
MKRSIFLLLIVVVAGCSSPARKADTSKAQPANRYTDACATRMHELCGPLLLYYATNRQLPQRAEELLQVSGLSSDVKELQCPLSHRPYVYNRGGLPMLRGQGRAILYDETAAHGGRRWAITIEETPDVNQPLVARVVALPDSFFPQ